MTLPPQLTEIRPPRGTTYDPATRVLTYRQTGVRFSARKLLRARVAPGTARGTPIELIGYASGPDDPFPVDDRGVDRAVVSRRAASDGTAASASATAGAAGPAGYCRLGPPYR